VIQETNFDDLAICDQDSRDFLVAFRGRGIAGRMIVADDDSGRIVDDGGADDLARINGGTIDRPDRVDDVIEHPVFRIDEYDEEHLPVGL